jgi:hypothetical protein
MFDATPASPDLLSRGSQSTAVPCDCDRVGLISRDEIDWRIRLARVLLAIDLRTQLNSGESGGQRHLFQVHEIEIVRRTCFRSSRHQCRSLHGCGIGILYETRYYNDMEPFSTGVSSHGCDDELNSKPTLVFPMQCGEYTARQSICLWPVAQRREREVRRD